MNLTETAVAVKTTGQLRKYGLLMASAFGVITVLLVLRGRATWVYTAVPSAVFLTSALAFPKALSPVEKYWMKLAAVMGFVMTNVLLVLVYIFAIVPTGLILRMFGKNSVRRGFQRNLDSYWIDVDTSGPSSRPEKPY
jgi:vacuolar-type H+-ATPase subunit I/STV1